jgi:hypothetical protein
MKISECCGALPWGGCEEWGMCSRCQEHCAFVEEEGRGVEQGAGSGEDSGGRNAAAPRVPETGTPGNAEPQLGYNANGRAGARRSQEKP